MDPQQELFTALLLKLKEKYEDTGIGVYDTFYRQMEPRILLFILPTAHRMIRQIKQQSLAQLVR